MLTGANWTVWAWPADSVHGRALDVLAPPEGPWAVVDRSARLYWAREPRRLFGLLEGVPWPESGPWNIRFLDDKPDLKWQKGVPTRRLDAVLEEREARGCQRLVGLSVWHAAGEAPSEALLRGVLGLGGLVVRREILGALASRVGEVLGIRVAWRCQAWPAGRRAVAISARRTLAPRAMSGPPGRLGLPPVEAAFRTGPLEGRPIVLVERKAWGALVGWSGRSEAGFCPLTLRNRSQRWAVVFLDGVPVASLPSGTSTTVTGIPCGYHRLAATTPLGSWSWGPVDTYVAGLWTLGEDGGS